MSVEKLPYGFLAAGRNVGIKSSKRDVGILISDVPAHVAACVSTNKSRAANVDRIDRLNRADQPVRAIITVSGNANSLTGPAGVADDEALAAEVATRIGVDPSEILTACTGVVGHRLPKERIFAGLDDLLEELSRDPTTFAESVLTTDRVTKIVVREVFLAGTRVRLHAVAKGAGMIAPSLATTLCFITTDAAVDEEALQVALTTAVNESLNQLTIDNDMSTNDAVVALANGLAENKPVVLGSPEFEVLEEALVDLMTEVAEKIASDGEGAGRRIDVTVRGAKEKSEARAISRAIAGSMLVKAAIFGADPNAGGRMIATAGAAASKVDAAYSLETLTLDVQTERLFERGTYRVPDPSRLRHRLAAPVVEVVVDLGQGAQQAKAWGCDLSYDYVKINADYAAITQTSADGRVAVNERLAELGPTIKKKLLIEALRYIDRFRGIRAVIELGGAAMIDGKLEEQFAEDVLLLRSVGLRPVVVHGGSAEITRALERLGKKTEFFEGLRITDASSMEIVEMVLSGSVNQRLVAALNRTGSRAVGLSGKDGGLIRASKLMAERDLGQVGRVDKVDVALIDMLEQDGYIPVISPVGLGEGGTAYNINADTVAAELAKALHAEKLIFMSDVSGLMEGDDVVSELTSDQLKNRLERGDIKGGMKPKLEAALLALAGGVGSVHLVDGRVQHNLIAELFTDRGVGTLIRPA
ncbi:MAG: bifunctional glutamate N-acetyltransferase/amino-acid acetyltransferase ArgJ [Deltaproteobacteria bacterium]|nr:bifunctional glutamate N-acetyltransferase/amino-acid acetyltransferase ArgJ [Deltaproteobacteria bacterium]